MATLATLVVKIATDTTALEKGLDRAQKQAEGWGSKFSKGLQGAGKLAIGGAVAGLGVGVAAVGKVMSEAIPLAADFQSQLVGLEIAASSSGLSFNALHDAALQVGGDTALVGVSATGAADAMTGLFKAGLSSVEIFGDLQGYMAGTAELGGALRASIDLAAATTLDMVQASDLASVALATFGGHLETEAERAEFINHALNNMVQAADASVAEVEDLGMALKNVGPTAAALGIPIESVNNALAILSTRGISGAEAGTALKSMLANLQRPTDAVTDTLKALNVRLYDSEGSFVGLQSLIGQLQNSMAGMTDEQRNLNVQTLAGTFGMNALNTLLSEGVDGWHEMSLATANAAGIQEQAAAKANTFQGRMEALDGAIETVKISMGEAFLPILQTLVERFAELVERYGPMVGEVFGTIGSTISSIANNLEEGMSPLNAFIEAIWGIAPQPVLDALVKLRDEILPPLVEWFDANVRPITNWISKNVELQDVLLGLAAAIGVVVIPIIAALISFAAPIIGAYLAVVAVAYVLREAWENNWGGIQEKVAAVWAWLQPTFETLRAWLAENLPVALETLAKFWENVLQPAIEGVWNFLTVFLIPVWKAIIEVWIAELKLALSALAAIWENVLGPALSDMWAFISEKLAPIVDWLKERVDNLTSGLGGLAGAADTVVGWLQRIKEKVENIELPGWMLGQSPSPWEMSLRGVAGALTVVNRELAGTDRRLSGFSPAGLGSVGGSGGSFTGGPFSVNINGGDRAEVYRLVDEAMRRYGLQADRSRRIG